MKKFKVIDTWVSMVLISAAILFGLIQRNETAIAGYFIVGGWQVASILIHSIKGWFTYEGNRRSYHRLVAVLAAASLIGCMVNPILWMVMFILLFASPFMALYYTRLCYQEVFLKMQRPMAALK